MLKSMTGFGRAENTIGNKTFVVDLKSLNGKQFDLSMRIPPMVKPYEFEIRKMLAAALNRGSAECAITLKDNGESKPVNINTDLVKAYYHSLSALADELKIDTTNILNALLKLPDVVTNSTETLTEAEWHALQATIAAAVAGINTHRTNEGAALQKELIARIDNICAAQKNIEPLQLQRADKIKEGLIKILEEKVGADNYDATRLEQELIYYIEKIDITEEQVRLANHCQYFKEIIAETEEGKGKKLSFILQEIGREINTMGSKAYDAAIQKIVVNMKDELEKAKEQVLNIL